MTGIINVLKPAGITSNAVITKIRKKLNIQRVGHLGTLDPDATGVLPICVGKATRLFDYFLNKNKIYRAVFVFGKSTDTLDSEGFVISQSQLIPSKEEIKKNLNQFLGKIEQMPPKYSAKNVNGVKAYKLARSNVVFSLSSKLVEITKFELIEQIDERSFLFEIECSSGTYVRSLCRDLAEKMNTIAYVGAIIRVQTGQFRIEDSVELSKIDEKSVENLTNVLKNAKKVLVPNEFYAKLVNGIKIHLENQNDCTNALIYCNNELIGIGNIFEGNVILKAYLKEWRW